MSAGWRSPGLRAATLPTAVSGLIMFHRPARSGLPSAVRGAGAVRFGLPSAVRGMPGVRYTAHCAASGGTNAAKVITAVKIFIGPNTPVALTIPEGSPDGHGGAARTMFVSLERFHKERWWSSMVSDSEERKVAKQDNWRPSAATGRSEHRSGLRDRPLGKREL